jgi:hypothetical protein
MVRSSVLLLGMALLAWTSMPASAQNEKGDPMKPMTAPDWIADSSAKLQAELVNRYGEAQRPRVQRGVKQVAEFCAPRMAISRHLRS